MAILDLQGLQEAQGKGGHSGASKQCGGGGNVSTLSLLLCF